MLEIRFHGRGGQGAVIASNVLALAFFLEGKSVQSFPSFGGERRGAPVMAFVRADNQEIGIRCNVYHPGQVIILDKSIIETMDPSYGLKKSGGILINTSHSPNHYNFSKQYSIATVDANEIAFRHRLGSPSSPIVNTAILGAFAKATRLVHLDSIIKAIEESIPNAAKSNVLAAKDAYESVCLQKAKEGSSL